LSKQVDSEAGLMAVALMTGARSILTEETRDDMRAAGLAHLLAISGLHIGLVAGSVLLLFRGLFALIPGFAMRYPVKKIAAALALVAAFFYLLLSGATIPTQRAFAMTGIFLLAIMLDRLAITMRLVAVVATVLLLFSPHMLMNVSFQMSFAAVVSLVAFYEAMRGKNFLVNRCRSVLRSTGVYLGGVAATSLIAGFSTGFIAAYHFNMFANYGLVANMVAVPVMSLWVMPMAILTFALMPFGLESLGLTAMTWGNEAILWSTASVHDWSASVLLLPALPMEAFVVATIGSVWWCLWRGRIRHVGALLVGIGCLGWFMASSPDILVDGDAKVFGVRMSDGSLVLSSRQAERRAGNTWLEHLGLEEARRINEFDENTSALTCDSVGCIFRPESAAMTAAIINSEIAIAEDCGRADVVISLVPLGWQCQQATYTVDRFDLWREGAHALWLTDEGLYIKTAAQIQGRRLWSSFPGNRLTDHSVLSD
jgi:competence protein ComEC